MNDPYGVLGVSPSASDADIKKAYRELARKYHPDNYHDNPLADLAQEKMKEINEAYDTITRMRSSGSSYQSTGGYSGARSGGYSASGNLNAVRMAINKGDLATAERLLASEPNRNAEWNFLMGSIYYKKGWMDDARSYFQRAASMDPTNPEYNQAFQVVNGGGYPYRTNAGPMANNTDMCDLCTAMMCANMLCRCN